MKTLRSHWRLVSVVSVIVLAIGVFAWRAAAARTTFFTAMVMQGEPEYTAMSPTDHDAVVGLLAETALDRDALIALNLSSSDAESVLDTVRSWYEDNRQTLASLQATIHQKAADVYALEKAIRVGPYDAGHEPALATAREDLATAKQAYRNALAPLESSVSALLSTSQRDTWSAIKTGHGQQMPLRMLDLDDSQRLAVSDARHRYRRRYAAAATQQERADAVSTWEGALDSVLTAGQKTAVSNYNSNYGTASAAVAEAIDRVLVTDTEG